MTSSTQRRSEMMARRATHDPKQRVRKDGVSVVDATADLMVFVTARDVTCAAPKDPCECAIAKAVKRAAGGAASAEVWRSFAYVKATNEDGELVWLRYRLSARTRARVEHFDKTGEAPAGAYMLKAPTLTQTLDYRARQRAKPTKNPGTRRVRTGGQITVSDGVRNGAGAVHHRAAA